MNTKYRRKRVTTQPYVVPIEQAVVTVSIPDDVMKRSVSEIMAEPRPFPALNRDSESVPTYVDPEHEHAVRILIDVYPYRESYYDSYTLITVP